MHLTTVWFVLIAFLWTGYFVLEGFDFGVGMLLPVLGRDEVDRRRLLRTLGPVWDGNEVWLIVAGAATFAAFPEWYASMFSGFYLALLLILVALIVRGLGLEYRNKRDDGSWHRRWDLVIAVGSALPAVLWGVAFGNIVRGVPLNAGHIVTGNLLTLLNPFALLAGLVTATLFALHGAVFVALKTDGDLRTRARAAALRIGLVATLLAAAFLIVTQALHGRPLTDVLAALAAAVMIGALVATRAGRDGWAFCATAGTLLLAVTVLFGDLWPDVLPSTTNAAFTLTVRNAASSPYTLGVMSWVALAATPFVLAYQAWSYWVFRQRVTRAQFGGTDDLPVPELVPAPRGPVEPLAPSGVG